MLHLGVRAMLPQFAALQCAWATPVPRAVHGRFHRAAPGGVRSCRGRRAKVAAVAAASAVSLCRWKRRGRRRTFQSLASAVHEELPPREALPPSPARLNEDQPGSAWDLGRRVFCRELGQLSLALQRWGLAEPAEQILSLTGLKDPPTPPQPPPLVAQLRLSTSKVAELEAQRGVPPSSPVVKGIFFVLCWSLDRLYEQRPIQKFWVLETVARLPYFSYITVLHLYESLGWWRSPEIRHIHSAEEDNELHHLLIMESLGGDTAWFDRFAAQHAALLYYWLVTGLFMASPESAYNFSLLVEEHAYVTYAVFAEENAQLLQSVAPPPIAVKYYVSGDLHNFDKFQTSPKKEPRRPPCDNLLDVFENIRDDELEHIFTMKACQEFWGGRGPSPIPLRSTAQDREAWTAWSAKVNEVR